MEFCSDIECSGVSSLFRVRQKQRRRHPDLHLHGSAIVRAQKPHPFFRDSGQFEERNHLKPVVQSQSEYPVWTTAANVDRPTTIGQDIIIPPLK